MATQTMVTGVGAERRTDAERQSERGVPGTRKNSDVPAGRRVHVERLILHGLNNQTRRLQLVDEPALLSDEIAGFFAQHIEAAMVRADWKARFLSSTDDMPLLCNDLLGDQAAFVAASQRLARRLFEAMRPRTIASGDFVAAVYCAGAGQRSVALLKLDPDQRLARTFTTVGGRRRVSIAAAGNLLPDTARLQKCALISAPITAAETEITLLDTQAGPRTDGVAAFFYRGFLGADLLPSPRRRTREFLRCCETWLSRYRDVLTPHEIARFYEARRVMLGCETLDLARFAAAALPEHPHLHADLTQHLTVAILPDTAALDTADPLLIDRAVAGGVTQRVTLELDGGARLTVPANRFAELVHIDPMRTADNKVRLVIESLTLKEVSER